jgi:hypothetical protein
VKTWQVSNASIASDFTAEPVGTSPTEFQLVYTPGDQVSTTAPLCVSTVLNVSGSYARLRGCAGLSVSVNPSGIASLVQATGGNGNQWQDFNLGPSVGDGFNQIEATLSPGPLCLNIKGWRGNGTQVISFPSTGSAQNQIWEQVAAP